MKVMSAKRMAQVARKMDLQAAERDGLPVVPQAGLMKVLVKKLKGDEASAGGIVIPERSRDDKPWAEVVSVGFSLDRDGKPVPLPNVKVGDMVVLGREEGMGFQTVQVQGETMAFVDYPCCIGVIPAEQVKKPEPKVELQ